MSTIEICPTSFPTQTPCRALPCGSIEARPLPSRGRNPISINTGPSTSTHRLKWQPPPAPDGGSQTTCRPHREAMGVPRSNGIAGSPRNKSFAQTPKVPCQESAGHARPSLKALSRKVAGNRARSHPGTYLFIQIRRPESTGISTNPLSSGLISRSGPRVTKKRSRGGSLPGRGSPRLPCSSSQFFHSSTSSSSTADTPQLLFRTHTESPPARRDIHVGDVISQEERGARIGVDEEILVKGDRVGIDLLE